MVNDLDIQFQKAYKEASKLREKLPPDVMLKLYAYYKQADCEIDVIGDQHAYFKQVFH